MCSADIFLGLLALLFPPLPVWVKCGICSADSLINILLCILGYVPGLLHAWYIIAKYPEPAYEYESLPQHNEGGSVTYVFVRGGHTSTPPQQAGMSYGTTSNNAPASPPPQPQQSGVANNAVAGNSSAAPAQERPTPPSYAEVLAGDHKIQTRD